MGKTYLSLLFFAYGAMAMSSPTSAQQAPAKLINSAASAHAALQRKGGMDAVNDAIAECWQNATKQASFDAAVFCSALNFTAANFDTHFLSMLSQRGYTPPRSALSMEDANQRSKRALYAAGVSEARVPILMDEIRRRVISETNKKF